jgi:AcrR family transcriptional regulator
MTRPSHNIDVLLFEQGEKLLLEVGVDQFSIRHLCKTANVNLGMFHYYFKTKEHFIELLFEQIFKRYLNAQKLIVTKHKKAIDQLRAVLFQRAVVGLENKQLLLIFFREAVNKSFGNLIKKHQQEELKFLMSIINQCKKDKDISKNLKMQDILPLIIPTINFPIILDMFKIEDIDNDGNIIVNEKLKFSDYINKLIDTIFRGLK